MNFYLFLFAEEPTTWGTIAAVVSAITAVIATAVGPYVAYKIAIHQINKSAVVAEHKEWIQQFRQDISNLLAKTTILRLSMENIISLAPTEVTLYVEQVLALQAQIGLRLDVKVPHHQQLVDILISIREYASRPFQGDMREFNAILEKCADLARFFVQSELNTLNGQKAIESKS